MSGAAFVPAGSCAPIFNRRIHRCPALLTTLTCAGRGRGAAAHQPRFPVTPKLALNCNRNCLPLVHRRGMRAWCRSPSTAGPPSPAESRSSTLSELPACVAATARFAGANSSCWGWPHISGVSRSRVRHFSSPCTAAQAACAAAADGHTCLHKCPCGQQRGQWSRGQLCPPAFLAHLPSLPTCFHWNLTAWLPYVLGTSATHPLTCTTCTSSSRCPLARTRRKSTRCGGAGVLLPCVSSSAASLAVLVMGTPQVNQVCWCWYPAFVAGAPMPLIAAANRCWAVRTRRKPARCAGVLP